MQFEIKHQEKLLIFDSELHGLIANNHHYVAGNDGVLIYDQVKNVESKAVTLQMSTNTSTLIPALRVLSWPYPDYFDQRPVIDSQNDITFYWQASPLAAFYNRFATDGLDFEQRPAVIEKAVNFLTESPGNFTLPKEDLEQVKQPCTLLGFYQGFPFFDASHGFAKLQSRLGIHVSQHSVMVSTPLDEYEDDIYDLANAIKNETQQSFSSKKNRVVFERTTTIDQWLNNYLYVSVKDLNR